MSFYINYNGESNGGGGGSGGVESLNGLEGVLTLAAGSGITITPSGGDTLTIAATASGANTALSNLASVAINTGLIFGAAVNGSIASKAASDGSNSGNMLVTTGANTGGGDSGSLTLSTGNSTTESTGGIAITSGTPGTNRASGSINLTTANATSNASSGSIALTTGTTASGARGSVSLTAGSIAINAKLNDNGTAGVINLATQNTSASIDSGGIDISAGTAVAGNGGGIAINGGDSDTGGGGSIFINPGSASGIGYGGSVYINGGESGATSPGSINLNTAGSVGQGGFVSLSSADTIALQSGGSTTITTQNSNELQINAAGDTWIRSGKAVRWYENSAGTGYAGFKANSGTTAQTIWSLPLADGSAGQVLSTNGSKVLGWSSLAVNPFIQDGNSFGATAVLGTNDANALRFETNNSPRLSILSTGEVGIGTTAPGSTVEINIAQNSGTNIEMLNSNSGTAARTRTRYNNGTSLMNVGHNGTGFSSSGGFMPNGSFFDATGANGLSIMASNAAGVIRLYTGATTAANERARVDAAGLVGIGLTAPVSKLHQDSGTATASYHQFTANATTGQTASDGFRVGIDASANAIINQQENLPLIFYTNAAEVARFAAAGNFVVPTTVTAGGTTGNQTINKISGTVNFLATATTLTVTNSLVTANSIVLAVVRTNDTTATIKNVVPASGSFVITLTAAATAETSVGFFVVN